MWRALEVFQVSEEIRLGTEIEIELIARLADGESLEVTLNPLTVTSTLEKEEFYYDFPFWQMALGLALSLSFLARMIVTNVS